MFGRSRTQALKDNATSAAEVTAALAKDKKFRKELLSGIRHGEIARRRATRRIGFFAVTQRLSADPKFRRELRKMADSLDNAWSRFDKKRSHKLRNTLIVLGVGGVAAAAAAPQTRRQLSRLLPGLGGGATAPRTIQTSIEVGVPVSTAYNQWTQFEDFPLFMEGVDHVQQLDDTRLHWAATIAGRQAEWDAKTLIGLSMSYQAEGLTEAVGSAAGLDERRVRGDLERFKELIESRGAETGAGRDGSA